MYCEAVRTPAGATTIRKPTTALSGLPQASEPLFGDHPPWSVITTATLVASLGIDRGNFATWRCRGIGPAELPITWFRAASGRPNYFMISDVRAWLATRHNQPFDVEATYRAYLASIHMPSNLVWVLRMAESVGPVQGDVRFTATGFRLYLDMLRATPASEASDRDCGRADEARC